MKRTIVVACTSLIIAGNALAKEVMEFQDFNGTDTVYIKIRPNESSVCANGRTSVVALPDEPTLKAPPRAAEGNRASTNMTIKGSTPANYCYSGKVDLFLSPSSTSGVPICSFSYVYDSRDGWDIKVLNSRTSPPCSSAGEKTIGRFCAWGKCLSP